MDNNAKAGSKTNLNESHVPLLDDIELEKEKIELKEKNLESDGEKDDSQSTEKADDVGVKESEVVIEEPRGARGPSVVQTLTVGLNLLDRDEHKVNEHVNLNFEDVIAEPENNHSFDLVWRLSFVVFSGTKLWTYRLLAVLCALPCALFWGVNFALLTFINIWFISPLLKTVDVVFYFIKKIWTVYVRTLLDPLFASVGMLFSNVSINVRHRTHQV